MDNQPKRWWVIKNDRGVPCKRCGVVHEFRTHNCRPVAFDAPWEWNIFTRVRVVSDPTVGGGGGLDIIKSSLGTPVEVTEREVQSLEMICNPPEGRIMVAMSRPGAAITGPNRR